MCGIFAFLSKESLKKQDILNGRAGRKLLKHRGPDEEGEWYNIKKGVYFGHTRLSIIDLTSKGRQPMMNNKYIIVYNGEIYNFLELKQKLETKGVKFNSNCDTEVLLYMWEHYKHSCLDSLDGMFAFAIWDGNDVWIARDKFGEKQLFYAKTENGIYISSELNPLVKLTQKKKNLDKKNIAAYMSLGYIPCPNTAYENIFSIEPGTAIKFKNGCIEKKIKYWDYKNFNKVEKINNNFLDDVNNEIIKSVKTRLYSDATKCLFLSSGIDSSLLAAIISKELNINIHSLTVGFKGAKLYDETTYAKKIANHLNLSHQIINSNINEKRINSKYILELYGQPNDNLTIIPTYQMACAANELNYKVGITGMGGDEISAGYLKQQFIKKYKYFYRIPEFFRFFISLLLSPLNKFSSKSRVFKNLFGIKNEFLFLALKNIDLIDKLKKLPGFHKWSKDIFYDFNGRNFLQEVQNFEFKNVMPNSRLICFDHGGMKASHEFRSPYLNCKLISLFNSLNLKPQEGNIQKFVFRELLKRYLPDKLIFNFKKGFTFSYKNFLKNNNKSVINLMKDKENSNLINNPSWERFLVRKEILNSFLRT